ncbi:NADH dehydrogenase [ubiquinone] 1 alpha subcomplex assembly factor 3 [Halyomorpha halys]|uniref:NADH dehydrogenase [ubiquinone] 1 alpha subcomplex assembly factor 3 n=1 Tax=Halyomorpha halys TaxID=286706 RepID=UPI0006D512F7|nr:NADH dehydrogenase [ubiquinone] 1 alpha subcomplex assembly factor 3 [Halyomorpha halys]
MLLPRIIHNFRFSRKFCLSALRKSSYEGDGKTSVTILNKEPGYGIMIDSYSKEGFRLNNGLFVIGPLILFPHTALSWNVASDQEINKNSLAVFNLIEPKLDLLIIGYGKKSTNSRLLHEEIMAFKSKERLNVEVLPVERAIATFNYLTSERRWVAGAFIPPEFVQLYESEEMEKAAKRKQTYLVDDYI